MAVKQPIDLHIDKLVLYGFSPGDRYRIGDSVETELVRLLTEQGIPPTLLADCNIRILDSGSFHLNETGKTGTIGSQIANSVYNGLKDAGQSRKKASSLK